MVISANLKLLAVLLALEHLDSPLNPSEQAALKKTGQRLSMHPKKWESTVEKLLEAFEANVPFKQYYQIVTTQLAELNDEISPEFLPTEEELKQILPPSQEVVKRAWFEGKPDVQSQEILNLTVNILTTQDPVNNTKKLNSLKKLWQFIKSHNQ